MLIETVNKMGYQATIIDSFSLEFVDEAGQLGKEGQLSLEVGCGFGVTVIAALKQGAKLYGNDLSTEHLDIIQKKLTDELQNNFIPISGDFRNVSLPQKTFHAILCSRVLHFFRGEEVVSAIKLLHNLLNQDGRLYLTVETPFLGNWKKFHPVYWNNKREGHDWPGLVENVKESEDSGRAAELPSIMHFFDIDTMVRVLTHNGFTIEKIEYINRSSTFPNDLLFDGRESLGVIAKKL